LAPYRSILLDIEGTTTPISFVYEVLFPYARRHLREYLEEPANGEALREPLRLIHEEQLADSLAAERSPEGRRSSAEEREALVERSRSGPSSVADYVESLMDLDRKSPGLKLLQGQIWEAGYRSGELKGEVFVDVVPALERWRRQEIEAAIYSSGSELAQRLLFGSTAYGDLTPYFARFFDTAAGAKGSVDSYSRIADALRCPVDRVLFVSDVTTELEAARGAGCQTRLCIRPGNRPQPPHTFEVIETFDQVP